jgi:SNF2 family DNA or RNA helicase
MTEFLFKTTPRDHQMTALEYSAEEEYFALLMEMGTGKSKVAIDTMVHLYMQGGDNGRIDCAVIIAPKGVYTNWTSDDPEEPGELLKHMPDEVYQSARIRVWKSSAGKAHLEALEDNLLPCSGLRVLAMNVEALSMSRRAVDYYHRFIRSGRCLVIIDESTTIKNPTANRTKVIVKSARDVEYRRILSGQPSPQSPLDIFSQFEFLDWQILGHKSFFTFRQRYAVLQTMEFGGRHVKVVVGYRNTEELHDKIEPYSYRCLKKDCLDLPPQQYFFRDVEMTREQWAAYNQMRDHAMAEIGQRVPCIQCQGEEGNTVCGVCGGAGTLAVDYASATAVITQILRLHQIVCGHITDENGVVHSLPSNRPQALLEQLEEAGDVKSIIWATYRYNIREICDTLSRAHGPDSVVHFYGGTSQDDRDLAKKRLQNDERCRFFVGSPATGKFGLTLTAAPNVVYYSNSHDLEQRDQSEQRTHRIGSEIHESINYTDLIVRGTVEERIIKNLRAKINTASVITGDAFREWLI